MNFLLIIAWIAHAPILLQYAARMWRTGHYQFFPLLLIAVAWIAWERKSFLFEDKGKTNHAISSLLLSLILILVSTATLLNSSFVGAVSAWLLAAISLFIQGGMTGLIRGAPLLTVLLFVVPLPARLDEKLVLNLQFISSDFASRILDNFGIVHFIEGVVLVTEKKQFMTEEACSGVRSFFSSLAGITLYSVVRNARWWQYIINWIQTVAWVLIGNAIRVAVIVYVSDRWTEAIATGFGHDVLGFATFLFVLMMSISTYRLIQALSLPEPERDFEYAPELFENEANTEVTAETVVDTNFPKFTRITFTILFGCVALFGLLMLRAQLNQSQGLWVSGLPRLPFPSEQDLPEKIGDWTRTEFQWRQRGAENLQAEDSFIWTYKSDSLEAKFSMDCPWDKWHNLADCYFGLGWQTDLSFQSDDRRPWVWSRIELSKFTGEQGIVFFRSVDRNTDEVAPQFSGGFFKSKSIYSQMIDNLAVSTGIGTEGNARLNGIALPATTFQLICIPETELTAADNRNLEGLFFELCNAATQSKRFTSKPNG